MSIVEQAGAREALRARGEVYYWLSAAFSQPEADILAPQFIRLGQWAAKRGVPAFDGAGLEALARDWAPPDDNRLLEMQQEYARLFIGPSRAAVRPYESCYFGEDQLMTARTDAVRTWYAAHGVVFDGQHGTELPDHVAVELLFLGLVCTGKTGHSPETCAAIEAGFRQEHASCWMQAFAVQVVQATHHPFYCASAGLLQAAIAEE